MRWLLASRWHVFWLALGALLFLDAARSLYARVGFEKPIERWQPNPADYADLTWPPRADLAATASLGARVYARRCAVCHGPDGRGNGPAAPSMNPRPRDFSAGEFKYKSTVAGSPPTEADLIDTVKNGLRASGMPFFRDLLTDAELRAVVTYLLSFNPAAGPDPIPVAVSSRVPSDAASIARGKKLYGEQGCVKCHGEDYRGGAKYEDAKGHPLIARDLTAPWTFRGGEQPEQLFLRLTTGMTPGPMPSYEATTTPEERWDLINFMRSMARVAPWERGGHLDGPGQDRDPVRRGDYLVHFEMCGLCHTQINETGIYREEGYFLAGGMRVAAYPHENVISRNLTSDPESGIGQFSVDQIAAIIRTGRRPDRTINPWGMPWFFLHALLPEDAQAIASYLKTMPPVYNLVPPPLKFGVLETLVAKLTSPLPAVVPVSLSYADGDFADPKGDRGISRELPQELMKDLQWIVLLAGAVLLIMAGPPGPRLPKRLGQWLKALGVSLSVFLLALIIWAIAELPASLPPDQLAAGTLAGIRKPDLAKTSSAEEGALLKRGQYLFTVSSCAFCHGNDGRGGAKISWKPFGTLWVRNITSDSETGLGAWTDEEIARAIRSGISKDGRQLHWQGMTWDLLSNLDEEDLRSLVAYVRALPPVKKDIPAARPPAPGDCEIYTFFLRGNLHQAGCN